MEVQHRGLSLIIGLDFGTTFSGVAWALEGSTSNDDIEVLTSWPGGGNRTSVKVPSVISYEDDRLRWGYQVGPLTGAFRGIKLLLDGSQAMKYAPSVTTKLLLIKSRKDVVQVAGDYLRQLVDQVREILLRRFGKASESMDLRFVLTVPAVWSDKAKDGTLRAAVQADIPANQISLVSEPEAAALYTLRAIQPNSIAEGDVFIVCDAGGGTVDLISYRINKLEPLGLVEVTEGTGGICGSMILDQRFEELLAEKMGDHYASLSPKSKEAALIYWQERVKPNFTGQFDEDFADVDYFIPLPGVQDDPSIPIEDGFLQLGSVDVEEIFEPVFQDVEKLIAQQALEVEKHCLSIKAIVLVGGFGSSGYLFGCIKEAYPEIDILQPPDAWSAVVRGAVHRGIDGNQVESRIARRHYGVAYSKVYSRAAHGNVATRWSALQEKYFLADTQMKWYIEKSTELCEDDPVKFEFYSAVAVEDAGNLVLKSNLYFCNDEVAPKTYNDRVMRLCTLEADLSRIPQTLFRRRKNSKGEEYFEIEFSLVMTPTSASLLFELEFQDISYGTVRSKY